jgi:lipopolysaccharide/colanic/teichoic acid biosynthesis glycosyltransferase
MYQTIFAVVFGKLRDWLSRQGKTHELYSADRMRKILERERARADRARVPLSVIIFTTGDRQAEPLTTSWLVKILCSRLRCLDEKGWLDEQRIGVVLPGTPPEGAWKVVADVCRNFPANVPPPTSDVYVYPDEFAGNNNDSSSKEVANAAPLSVILMKPLPVWKRSLDVCGAFIGLVLLAPLLAVIAVAIKLTSPGPVFFRQRRSGHGGRPFVICKFRTMVVDAESRKAALLARNERDGPAFKIKHDPRITRLGWLLRTTSLDELPQLWNVFKGDMSLVGPRPLPCSESDGCVGWQRQRLDVTPGLTCIWQVRGRNGVSFADWVRMDVCYIRSRSLWYDLKLLMLTIPAVVLRRGAH